MKVKRILPLVIICVFVASLIALPITLIAAQSKDTSAEQNCALSAAEKTCKAAPADCQKTCCEAKKAEGTCALKQGAENCPKQCPKSTCSQEKTAGSQISGCEAKEAASAGCAKTQTCTKSQTTETAP